MSVADNRDVTIEGPSISTRNTDRPLVPVLTRFDRDMRLIYASPSADAAWNLSDVSAAGDQSMDWHGTVRDVIEAGAIIEVEWQVPFDGDNFWFHATAVPEFASDGSISQVVVMTRDITAVKSAITDAAPSLVVDPLTGLAHRPTLLERLSIALAHPDRGHLSVALLYLDLDRFKVINDSLGHAVGDELLRATASRLLELAQPTDLVARVGGDVFVVLLEGLDDGRDPVAFAQQVHEAMSVPFTVHDDQVLVTSSIGIAVASFVDTDADELMRDADVAMYHAKERGRDRFELFDDVLRAQAMVRRRTETYLRRALERGEFEVFYQPELSLETGLMVGAEALVRWHHPEDGLLDAGKFIEFAEESGVIVELGAWVLMEACRQAGEWQRSRPESPIMMRVNLSARQLSQPNLVAMVVAAMAAGGIEPDSLCLEITETALMADPVAGIEMLQALRALGVGLAIDDFGTGHSSLSNLKRFPVDVLKIDRAFVDGLGTDADDSAIVTAIIGLGRALGLTEVAEGVETASQLAELRRLGCGKAQGYMFARPGPASLLWDIESPYPMPVFAH
ncbi:MAG: EAL domain-containing protein [Actinomycetes bacterium]